VLARRAIPPELLDRFETVSRAFGVTDTALTTFFRILGENKVAPADLDAKLREVAARHLTLLRQAAASLGDDPQVVAIKQQAVPAIAAGDYDRAGDLLQRAFDADLAVARRADDAAAKHYLTAAKTRAGIGELNFTQLRYAAAARDFQAAADLVPAGQVLVRAEYLATLGEAAYRAGNYPLAAQAWAEALHIQERTLGSEHPEVATSLSNLALVYKDQARYAEAEPLYRRALAIDEKVLGPEHPDVAIRVNNLAVLYRVLGRHAEAEPLSNRVLALGEKVLGPDHPDVAIYLNNLALLYQAQGRYLETEPLLQRALAISEKVLGPAHPAVAIRLNNLALLCQAQGRLAEAERLFERALAIDEKVLGPEHPTTNVIRKNLRSMQDNLARSNGAPSGARPR